MDEAAWDILDADGAPALAFDSVVSVEYLRESRVSDYPVESGGFASYNKVATPADARLTLARGGSESDRAAFLGALDSMVDTVDLFSIVTPETILIDMNVTRYDYRRTSSEGVSLIIAELHLLEVRGTATAVFTKSKAPSGSSPVNNGAVQPKAPAPSQTPAKAPT